MGHLLIACEVFSDDQDEISKVVETFARIATGLALDGIDVNLRLTNGEEYDEVGEDEDEDINNEYE